MQTTTKTKTKTVVAVALVTLAAAGIVAGMVIVVKRQAGTSSDSAISTKSNAPVSTEELKRADGDRGGLDATNIAATRSGGVDSCSTVTDPATAAQGYWDSGNYSSCADNKPTCVNGSKKVIESMTLMPDGSVKYSTACVLPITALQTVATPTATPVAGTYATAQSVTLTTTTSGADIYYTTNGSDPTTSSTHYTTAIAISSTTTLKAIAVKSGMTNSAIMTASYVISASSSDITTVSAGVLCRPTGTEYATTVTCPDDMALVQCGLDETTGKPWTHTDSAFFANASTGQFSNYWVSRAKDGSNSCQIRISTKSESLCSTSGTYWTVRAFCSKSIKTNTVTTASADVACTADGTAYSNTVSCPANTTLLNCGIDETTGQPWTHTDSAVFADTGHGNSFYWDSRAKDGGNSCKFDIKTNQSTFCTSTPWKLRAFCAPIANAVVTTSAKGVTCAVDGQAHSDTVSCPANTTLLGCGVDETTGQPWTHTDTLAYADAGGSSTSIWTSRAKDGSNSCQFSITSTSAGLCSSPWSVRAFCQGTSVPSGSVQITSPNGGEIWNVGETHDITWTSANVNNVKIYIFDSRISGSGSTNYITPNSGGVSASPGSYGWTITQSQLPVLPSGSLPNNYTIRIDGFDANGNQVAQDSSNGVFTINTSQVSTSTATPTASPVAGTYTSAQNVTLATDTVGAVIHYTTDGTTPTVNSTTYTVPVAISASKTLKAIATKSGMTNSGVLTAAYVINEQQVATPTASPAAGTYDSEKNVSLATATTGASIRYTTNGSTPTSASTLFGSPIKITKDTTIKAIALKTGMTNSNIMTAVYKIKDSIKNSKYYKLYKYYRDHYHNKTGKSDYLKVRDIRRHNMAQYVEMKNIYLIYKGLSKNELKELDVVTLKKFYIFKHYNGYKNYLYYREKVGA